MIVLMNLLIYTASLAGFFSAATALYGRYYTLPSFLTGPNICKLEAGGCQVLFRTKNAALLGVPNSALGILYYPLLAVGFFLHWPFGALFGAASFAFCMTLVLAFILIKNKLECRICWLGHISNTVIWLSLLVNFVPK